MSSVKNILKNVIARTCPPTLQHWLRRYYLARRVLHGREFHEVEMNVLATIVRAGDTVADIGANVGAYTKHLSSLVGNGGRVQAFEPVSANYDILESVVTKGRLTNVELFRLALGATVEEREITVPDLGGFTGYYWAHFAEAGERGEKVAVSTLDELHRRGTVRELQFIKCDVEGYELEVLSGATELIVEQHPAWLLEVARQTSADVFKLLIEHGYRAFVYDGELQETFGYRDKEFSNYFFLHPLSVAWQRLDIR